MKKQFWHNFCAMVCLMGLAFILGALSNRAYGQGIQKGTDGNYFQAHKAANNGPATLESLTLGAKRTDATFTTAKGERFPVYLSKNGSAFVVRVSKKGVVYRQYMPK